MIKKSILYIALLINVHITAQSFERFSLKINTGYNQVFFEDQSNYQGAKYEVFMPEINVGYSPFSNLSAGVYYQYALIKNPTLYIDSLTGTSIDDQLYLPVVNQRHQLYSNYSQIGMFVNYNFNTGKKITPFVGFRLGRTSLTHYFYEYQTYSDYWFVAYNDTHKEVIQNLFPNQKGIMGTIETGIDWRLTNKMSLSLMVRYQNITGKFKYNQITSVYFEPELVRNLVYYTNNLVNLYGMLGFKFKITSQKL
jgi:hypothetical protein